jgi:hypothetical protein
MGTCTLSVGRLSFCWMRYMYLVQWKAFILVDEVHVPHTAEGFPSGGWGTCTLPIGRVLPSSQQGCVPCQPRECILSQGLEETLLALRLYMVSWPRGIPLGLEPCTVSWSGGTPPHLQTVQYFGAERGFSQPWVFFSCFFNGFKPWAGLGPMG